MSPFSRSPEGNSPKGLRRASFCHPEAARPKGLFLRSFGANAPQDDHHHVTVCNRMEEYPETSPNPICCGKPMYRMD